MAKGIKGFQKGHPQFIGTERTQFKKGIKYNLGKHWKVKDTTKMKGHTWSEERRKQRSEIYKKRGIKPPSAKGRILSEETKKKNDGIMKPVNILNLL